MLLTGSDNHECKALDSSIITRSVPLLSRGHVGAIKGTGWGARGIKPVCLLLTSRTSNSIDCEHQPSHVESTNMFIRASTALFSVVAFAGLATATLAGPITTQCDPGSRLQCCDRLEDVRFPSSTLVTLNTEGSFTIAQLPVYQRALSVQESPFAPSWHPSRV